MWTCCCDFVRGTGRSVVADKVYLELGEWLKLKYISQPPSWCPEMFCIQEWNLFPSGLLVVNLSLYSAAILSSLYVLATILGTAYARVKGMLHSNLEKWYRSYLQSNEIEAQM